MARAETGFNLSLEKQIAIVAIGLATLLFGKPSSDASEQITPRVNAQFLAHGYNPSKFIDVYPGYTNKPEDSIPADSFPPDLVVNAVCKVLGRQHINSSTVASIGQSSDVWVGIQWSPFHVDFVPLDNLDVSPADFITLPNC